jgi:hypothetical protein
MTLKLLNEGCICYSASTFELIRGKAPVFRGCRPKGSGWQELAEDGGIVLYVARK